jgi:hypothetical protein
VACKTPYSVVCTAAHTCEQQASSRIWKSESPLRTLTHAGTTVPDYVIEIKLMIWLQEKDRLLCKSGVRRVNCRSLVAG